jgi:signal transduction histidine kinase
VLDDAARIAVEKAGPAASQPRIRIEPVNAIPAARGDARQIRNALAEVILNALQASRLPDADPRAKIPGEVQVQARFDPLDQQVVVQVRDFGVGMSEEILRNAFSPFFSAKNAGRNRGMGLAKALRWIENHGGTIRLDSAPGGGTTVVIMFPLNPATAETAASSHLSPAIPARR